MELLFSLSSMSYHVFSNATCRLATIGLEANTRSPAIPFYFAAREHLVGNMSDAVLSMIAPVIAFWSMSVAFDLDHSRWKWLDPYRIHEPNKIKSRNLVSRSKVISSVIPQHVMQIVAGLINFPGWCARHFTLPLWKAVGSSRKCTGPSDSAEVYSEVVSQYTATLQRGYRLLALLVDHSGFSTHHGFVSALDSPWDTHSHGQ